jgi:two-component system cell cycle response regulator
MTDVSPPDVYLIEEDLGSAGSGLRMMSELMSRPFSRNCTFAILTNDDRVQGNSVVFDLGADDLIASTISGEEIALRLSRLLQRKRRKDVQRSSVQDGLRMAMIDPLTGLHNRRFGLARLAVIAQEAKVTGLAFAILVVDIDRFKLVNDTLGHSAGDTVLMEVAERLAMNIRQGDLVARIGGEEFLIVLPVTTLAEAQIIADRVRDQVEANAIYLANRKRVCVTVSIGLAMSGALNLLGHQNTIAEIIDRADHALMAAKSGGRNKVTIARNAA